MAKKSTSKKTALTSLMSQLDGDPKIRAALIARIVKAADKAPVIMLHQIAMMLDMHVLVTEPSRAQPEKR